MSETLIRVRSATISYDNLNAVEDISFDINAGDYICIIGENGSGKSSLLKGILSLRQLRCGDVDYVGISRRELGYLPQQTAAQRDFPASVREVVVSGFLGSTGASPFYSRAQKAQAEENMELMGIHKLASRSYRELSGGQQQRVMLARALCASRRLLLLDEPLTGLDPVASNELYELIDRLNASGVTIVMVTHDIEGALLHAKQILQLETRMVFFGTVHEYRHSAEGERFLGRCRECQ